jgi:hypothetical protein
MLTSRGLPAIASFSFAFAAFASSPFAIAK